MERPEDLRTLKERLEFHSIPEDKGRRLLAVIEGLYEPSFKDIVAQVRSGPKEGEAGGLRYLISNMLGEGLIEFTGRKVQEEDGERLSFAYRVPPKYSQS